MGADRARRKMQRRQTLRDRLALDHGGSRRRVGLDAGGRNHRDGAPRHGGREPRASVDEVTELVVAEPPPASSNPRGGEPTRGDGLPLINAAGATAIGPSDATAVWGRVG